MVWRPANFSESLQMMRLGCKDYYYLIAQRYIHKNWAFFIDLIKIYKIYTHWMESLSIKQQPLSFRTWDATHEAEKRFARTCHHGYEWLLAVQIVEQRFSSNLIPHVRTKHHLPK